jgi:hypothetical protein
MFYWESIGFIRDYSFLAHFSHISTLSICSLFLRILCQSCECPLPCSHNKHSFFFFLTARHCYPPGSLHTHTRTHTNHVISGVGIYGPYRHIGIACPYFFYFWFHFLGSFFVRIFYGVPKTSPVCI